ncbi:MAG: AAA family ATPase [Phycisphaerae bacterium]
MAEPRRFFAKIGKTPSLFKNREALTEEFLPQNLPYRDREGDAIARILAPSLWKQKPSNALIYGNPGTGKTAVTRLVLCQLQDEADRLHVPLKVLYVNCNIKGIADTEYRAVREFVHALGGTLPHRGLSKTEAYELFFDLLNQRRQHIIVVFDEIDRLMRHSGTDFLYTFTRIALRRATVSLVGITNNTTVMNYVDGRIRSSLSQQQVVFSPYNATQLATILSQRMELAFQPGVVEPAAINKCAALGAQEHGDARRSLNLLRVAAETAHLEGAPSVAVQHVDRADEIISEHTVLQLIRSQPRQHTALLHCILSLCDVEKRVQTGEVYTHYAKLVSELGLRCLTPERVSNILADLDTIGLIHSHVVSRGRFGRSREISVILPEAVRKLAAEEIKTILNL